MVTADKCSSKKLTAKVCCPGFWNPKARDPSYFERDVGTFMFSLFPLPSSSKWNQPFRPWREEGGSGGGE